MTSEFTVRYTKPLVRTAVARFWRRTLGWGFFLALAALATFVLREVSLGDRSWSMGVFGTVTGMGLVVIVAGFAAQYRHHMASFRSLETSEAVVSLSDEMLGLSSINGTMKFPWTRVRKIWKYPDLWLLVFSPNSFATLPLAGVPSDALEVLEHNVRRAGGRVA